MKPPVQMKVLILDDNRVLMGMPLKSGLQDYSTAYVVQPPSVTQFLNELYSCTWDEVWLDHDLGTGLHSGRTVTRTIQEHAIMWDNYPKVGIFLITTNNTEGAKYMFSDLSCIDAPVILAPMWMLHDHNVWREGLIPHYNA